MDEDRLISLPPTDMVLQKRQAALQSEAEARQRQRELKPARVKESYFSLLQKFSDIYFKGTVRYDGLSPKEQKIVAKICLRQSLKTTLIVSASITIGFTAFVSMLAKTAGDVAVMSVLGLMLATITVCGIEALCEVNNWFCLHEKVQFIWKHLYLKRKKLLSSLFQ